MTQVARGSAYLVVLGIIGCLPAQALSAEVILGSTNDSTVNSAPAIQAALDAVEARGGGVVRLTGGVYYIGDGALTGKQGLKIGNNTHLLLDQDAVIIRNFAHGGDEGATIRNKCQVAADCTGGVIGNEHIRVSGGTIKTENPAFVGHHLGFRNVDWLEISNMRFRGVFAWNVSLRDANDVIVSNLSMDSGVGLHSAGVQVTGGARIVIADCDITCGDDSIALVCDVNPGSANISDVAISNCYLHSRLANPLKILVEETVTKTIGRVTVSNIVAKVGQPGDMSSQGIIIFNDNLDTRQIFDGEIDGFWLDASENFGEMLWIDGVERVRLDRVVIRNPKQRARISASDDVALINCIIDMGSHTSIGQPCLIVAQPLAPAPPPPSAACSNIRIVGGEYRGAKQHAIQIGTNTESVTGFEISNALIEGATNNGILLQKALNGRVIGNRIVNCGNLAIQELPGANDNLILGNWISFIGPMAGTISFVGSRTQVVRNWAAPGVPLPDSGGFRQTVDGWYADDVGANVTTAQELNRFTFPTTPTPVNAKAGRFRAVRNGWITGVVVTSTATRSSGTLTVTVWRNPGLAEGITGLVNTGVSAQLDATNTSRHAVPVPSGAVQFFAGDELFLQVTTSGWGPTTADIRCAIEIED
jgi:hypothetical protein